MALRSDPTIAESGSKNLWRDHVIIEEEKTEDNTSNKGRRRVVLTKAKRGRKMSNDLET